MTIMVLISYNNDVMYDNVGEYEINGDRFEFGGRVVQFFSPPFI